MKDFFQSKVVRTVAWIIFGMVVLLVVFQLGVWVGFRKANFSFRWAENYHRTFGGPRGGFFGIFTGGQFLSGHGVAGTVAKVDNSSLVVTGSDGVESLVKISTATLIRQGGATITLSGIQPGDSVVVIGTPADDGTIDAKIIRVFNAQGSSARHGLFGF